MSTNTLLMKRCFDLASFGKGNVSPNPTVGAVIVYKNLIIGEGFHEIYGGPHAEVNAINSVKNKDKSYIKSSRLFISLEPCCIYGKTPPCSSLIVEKAFSEVFFSVLDQTPGVNGKSIDIMESANIKVQHGLLQTEGFKINAIRNTFVKKRPFVILKYAKSKDGFLSKTGEQSWLTGYYAKVLVHKWRSECDAIMVGTNTAMIDNPQLTNRLYSGKSPLRIVLDRNLRLDNSLLLFDQSNPTWVINSKINQKNENLEYICRDFNDQLLPTILSDLYENNKSTLIVEGGARLLSSFIKLGLWDEARVFTSVQYLNEGVKAPSLQQEATLESSHVVDGDILEVFKRESP